ncbi:transposase [Luteolibacter ambystomatis]|uniref:Transposase n=2 Tax=Luteolibacter ambystomatis TaxID=2824561 RepID=A0A975G7P5_9BACT|nr:transposase [Luteolibacter ambystomatis]
MSYAWRSLTPELRKLFLLQRKRLKRPWHRPPHFEQRTLHYHLTGSCYEHQYWIGCSAERMGDFSQRLVEAIETNTNHAPAAWCVLPNHYHVLVRAEEVKPVVAELARLHGRTSFEWNREENARGRKIWHGVADRAMRGEGHFWATINYIHHNPVKHGHVEKWDDWPFSSAIGYLDEVGRDEATRTWKAYPILDYGKGWDD